MHLWCSRADLARLRMGQTRPIRTHRLEWHSSRCGSKTCADGLLTYLEAAKVGWLCVNPPWSPWPQLILIFIRVHNLHRAWCRRRAGPKRARTKLPHKPRPLVVPNEGEGSSEIQNYVLEDLARDVLLSSSWSMDTMSMNTCMPRPEAPWPWCARREAATPCDTM